MYGMVVVFSMPTFCQDVKMGLVFDFFFSPLLNFDLNQFSDLPDITQRVSDIAFLGGETDTARALELVYDNIFSIQGKHYLNFKKVNHFFLLCT